MRNIKIAALQFSCCSQVQENIDKAETLVREAASNGANLILLPELFEREVLLLKEKGVFDVVNGVLVGKPQDEVYYQEYKDILIRVIDNEKLPIVYNVNFGHAMPRCALQYGAVAKVDMKQKKIYVNR